MKLLARIVLEDRAASRQLQEMMHTMNMNNASNEIAGEVGALKELILVLGHQVAQIGNGLIATWTELTTSKNELTATKNELISNKSEMEALKSELTAMIQTRFSNIQVSASTSPSCAAISRTPPDSQPSNLPSFSSRSLTPSTLTDTIYCTIDTSRMNEEDKSKTQPRAIREIIEKEMRTHTERSNWHCTAVTRDPRNTARIQVTCRVEAELKLVKEATQKNAALGLRVFRDQLYPTMPTARRCWMRMVRFGQMRQRYSATRMKFELRRWCGEGTVLPWHEKEKRTLSSTL